MSMFLVDPEGVAIECWRGHKGLEAPDRISYIRLKALGFETQPTNEPPRKPLKAKTPRPAEAQQCIMRGTELLAENRYEEALCLFEEARRLKHPHAQAAIARCNALAAAANVDLI